MSNKTALILSGGGARGAYQVGVLKGVSFLLKKHKMESPFKIISGTSAGAINAAKIASSDDDFHGAVDQLIELWSKIKPDQVFQTDLLSKFGFGSFLSSKKLNSLLDTSPLKKLIEDNCDFSQIQKNLETGKFESIIVTANNYSKNRAISFVQSASVVNEKLLFWQESRRQAVHASLTANHIMASSAIPMLFPPIEIAQDPYGDGCVRNNTPCSPSIRMGAEKLFVIGVRTQVNGEVHFNQEQEAQKSASTHQPAEASMIKILNTLLNAVLLDSVEQDVQRIQRINHLVAEAQANNPQFQSQKLKKIPALCISPSQDIGEIARHKAHHLPRILRMSIGAFGSLDEASEIISYLLFDGEFCRNLIQMGYDDCLKQQKEIMSFFEETV